LQIACLDLEGVLVPEIWLEFAERTGVAELRATTRDVPDYDMLMRHRLTILRRYNFGLAHIQGVIAEMRPLPGAVQFVDWLRERFQVMILSDTFYEFALPLMKQLGYPALLCHRLQVDDSGMITGYLLRQQDQKRMAVRALHGLNFKVAAAGDSYNDTGMLAEADVGILFRAPDPIVAQFPQFSVTRDYVELQARFLEARRVFEGGTA
jgi:phosphoserine / homoserine phosphotransferase